MQAAVSQQIKSAAVAAGTSLDCHASSPFVTAAATKIQDIINTTEELPSLDIPAKLNHVIAKHILLLVESLEEENSPNIHELLTLLDISLALDDNNEQKQPNTAVNVLVHICSLLPTDTLITSFLPAFLVSTDRMNLLTQHNTLRGKVKPGSRLIVLHNLIAPRLAIRDNESAQLTLGKFRTFILNAFLVSDKLNRSHDWHSRPLTLSTGPIPNPLNITIANLSDIHHLSTLELFVKDMQGRVLAPSRSRTHSPRYIPLITKTNKLDLWTAPAAEAMDDTDFAAMSILQIKIFLEFILAVNGGTLSIPPAQRSKSRDISSIYMSPACVRKANYVLNQVTNYFKLASSADPAVPNPRITETLVNVHERAFNAMKASAFTHPPLPALASFRRTTRVIETVQSPNISAPRYPHKLGTPGISKAWRIPTTMNGYHVKRFVDIAERTSGNTDKHDDKNVETSRQQWKHYRATRELSWFELCT